MVGFRIAARWGNLAAPLLPPLALVLCLWVLGQQLGRFGMAALVPALSAIPAWGWLAACTAAAVSFAAVGRFELAVRDTLGLGGPRDRAARAGILAVAVAQTAGFGAVTGALARWRALPELGGPGAARLALAVSVAFLAVLAFWTGAALLTAMGGQAGLLIAMVAVGFAAILRLRPLPRLPGLRPAAGAMVMLWGAVDVAAGATVLALLLPTAALPGWPVFLAAYLTALLAGFLSQSPGGLGAFEVTLLALLPAMPEAELLAGLLAYRLVYHLIPAALALALLARPAVVLAPPALVALDGSARDRGAGPRAAWRLGACAQRGADPCHPRPGAGVAYRPGGTVPCRHRHPAWRGAPWRYRAARDKVGVEGTPLQMRRPHCRPRPCGRMVGGPPRGRGGDRPSGLEP